MSRRDTGWVLTSLVGFGAILLFVAWRNWLLDFYVDVTNVALLPEEVQAGSVIRYVLPTVGLRGRF